MITALSTCNYAAHSACVTTTSLGSQIKALREDRGWNQTELAERAGVLRAHLSQIESGKIALPNADIRRRLAKALGISHLDLLIAAGEITPDEIAATGSEGIVERDPNDQRERIIERIRALPWDDAWAKVFDGMLDVAQSVPKAGAQRGTRERR